MFMYSPNSHIASLPNQRQMRVWHFGGLRLLLDYVYLHKLTPMVVADRSTIKDECATVLVLVIAKLTPMVRLGNRTYRVWEKYYPI